MNSVVCLRAIALSSDLPRALDASEQSMRSHRDQILELIARIRQFVWLSQHFPRDAKFYADVVERARVQLESLDHDQLWRSSPECRVTLWSASGVIHQSVIVLDFNEHSALLRVSHPLAPGSAVSVEYRTLNTTLRFRGDMTATDGDLSRLVFDGP